MVELYPHNQKAYDAVMSHFAEGHKRACVIQPCGTGKAVVLAAVAQHFDKIYMVAPNEHIHNQAKKVCDKDIVCLTYQSLAMENCEYPTDADLIIFDEMHRMGAISWSKGCERLMKANPNAHILGLTATPVRALEQRDMAKEYFDGHVVGEMSLTDAWCHGVLKAPQKYVIGLVSMDNEEKYMLAKIRDNKRMDEETKKRASAKVINLCRDWSLSNGVPRIIEKYWDESIKKVAVFCPTIAMADSIEPTLRGWFKDAGYDVNKVYVVHSENTDAVEKIQDFEDNNEGLNILVSVSMLNEGVHPKGVGSVILLRSTVSKNLYLQQIGRCFSVDQKTAPVVFDFADNVSSACLYDEIYSACKLYNEQRDSRKNNKESEELRSFAIVDIIKTARDLQTLINTEFSLYREWSFDEVCAEAKKYTYFEEFYKKSPAAFAYAYRKGWIEDACAHLVYKRQYLSKDQVMECAKRYRTLSDFRTNERKAYNQAYRHGWLDAIKATFEGKRYTLEQILTEAKKYTTKSEFRSNAHGMFYEAEKNGWIEQVTAHMQEPFRWTLDLVLGKARECETLRQFWKEYKWAYNAALRYGWLDEVHKILKPKKRKAYTYEDMLEAISHCADIKEFRSKHYHMYNVAIKKGWLKDLYDHMGWQFNVYKNVKLEI